MFNEDKTNQPVSSLLYVPHSSFCPNSVIPSEEEGTARTPLLADWGKKRTQKFFALMKGFKLLREILSTTLGWEGSCFSVDISKVTTNPVSNSKMKCDQTRSPSFYPWDVGVAPAVKHAEAGVKLLGLQTILLLPQWAVVAWSFWAVGCLLVKWRAWDYWLSGLSERMHAKAEISFLTHTLFQWVLGITHKWGWCDPTLTQTGFDSKSGWSLRETQGICMPSELLILNLLTVAVHQQLSQIMMILF